VIGAYLCYTASFALISYPAGKLADRLRKEMLLGLGMLVYAGVYLGLAMITSPWLIWPLFLFYGLYSALTDGVGKALIAGLVPSEARATALGVFQMVTGIMSLLASIVAGVLWDAVSPATPFYLGAALAVIGGVGFLIWRPSATTT
jgi:MFS family permease